MVILASIFGCIAVAIGLLWSLFFNVPTGPAIVVCATGIFMMSQMVPVRE